MILEDIHKNIETDSAMNKDQLSNESLNIPVLWAKYYRILTQETRVLKSIELDIDKLYREMYDAFIGNDDELMKKYNVNKKSLKTEVDERINAQPDMITLRGKYAAASIKVKLVEDFIKQLNQRSFMIKNIIDWEKFKAGGY